MPKLTKTGLKSSDRPSSTPKEPSLTDGYLDANTGLWVPPTLENWLQAEQKNARWILPGLLAHEAIHLLSGQQKRAHKTWLADAIAIAVATGRPVGPLQALARFPVLYIQEEGTFAGTKNRMLGLLKTAKIAPSSVSGLFFAFRRQFKLDSQADRTWLLGLIDLLGIRLVILDALTYMHAGDENSNRDMHQSVDTLQAVRARECAILALAHLDKNRGEQPNLDIDTQVRGATIVVNAYDVHLALRRYDAQSPEIALTIRSREAAEQSKIVRWTIRGAEENASGESELVEARLEIECAEQAQARLGAKAKLGKIKEKKLYTRAELTKLLGGKASVAGPVIDEALQAGTLQCSGDNYWRVVDMPVEPVAQNRTPNPARLRKSRIKLPPPPKN